MKASVQLRREFEGPSVCDILTFPVLGRPGCMNVVPEFVAPIHPSESEVVALESETPERERVPGFRDIEGGSSAPRSSDVLSF